MKPGKSAGDDDGRFSTHESEIRAASEGVPDTGTLSGLQHAQAAEETRYRRIFGYYDGLAGVASDEGWFHIDTDGNPLYSERYRWVGNFQCGLCTVRLSDGRYRHIDRDGDEAYPQTYRYAGDFRNGAAMVQNDEGFHTHIDREGDRIHGRWFEDLGVFHKGFAPARDKRGWHHIDRDGESLYRRRFAEVEPFYNGQARVRRFDGGLEVIDESGAQVLELRGDSTMPTTPEQELSADRVGPGTLLDNLATIPTDEFQAASAIASRKCHLTLFKNRIQLNRSVLYF